MIIKNFEEVLTIGASGMIGSYVDFGLRPSKDELDVLDADAVEKYVLKHKPSAIILLSGATDMAKTEKEPLYAYELNVRGTYNVACAAKLVGATLVYASTSRVFGGDKDTPYTEEDVPEPKMNYARTKYFGELVVANIVPSYIIARTSWVFGGGRKRDNKFYGNIIRQMSESKEVLALSDVFGSPTYGKDYIATIKDLLTKREAGIFHVANEGVATRYDLACHIAKQLKSDTKVRAVDRSFFESANTLPTNESIASSRCKLRPWREALTEYIENEWNNETSLE